jgi:hypothetical protein
MLLIFASGLIMKIGSARVLPRGPGSSIERHAGMLDPNAIQKLNNRLGLYPIENGLSKRKQLLQITVTL